MRPILFVTDIHSDARALGATLAIARSDRFIANYGAFGKVICLGDVYERYNEPALVTEMLSALPDMDMVLGNHDEALMLGEDIGGGDGKSRYKHRQFKRDGGLGFIAGRPTLLKYPDLDMVVAHGGANTFNVGGGWANQWLASHTWQRLGYVDHEDPYTGYMYTPMRAFDTARELFADNGKNGNGTLTIVGHNHQEMAFVEACGEVYELDPPAMTRPYPGETVMFCGVPKQQKYKVRSRTVALNHAYNYIFAVGATSRYQIDADVDTVSFAMLHDDREKFTLLNFDME